MRALALLQRVSVLRLLCIATTGACLVGCGDDSSSSSGGGDPVEIQFSGTSEIFPGLDYSTGLLPEGSPVQAAFSISATGESAVSAVASPSGSESAPVLTGLPGRGELRLDGGFAMVGQLKIEIDGLPSYDGPIPGIENVEIPIEGSETFDPFVIDGKATVRAEIPEADLPGIPLPAGIPGQLVLAVAPGSFVEQDFVGVCAGADGVDATYDGRFERRGSLVVAPRIEIDVPIVGTTTYDIPAFTVELALPSSDVAMETKIESFGGKPSEGDTVEGSCDGSGQGGSGSGGAGQGPSSTGSDTSTGTDGSGGGGVGGGGDGGATSTSTSMTSSSTGGTECLGGSDEPNESLGEATIIADDLSCGAPGMVVVSGLDGLDDVDAYAFTATADFCPGACGDATTCPTRPGLVDVSPANADVTFCLFVNCGEGLPPDVFFCEDGEPAQDVGDGILGCCANRDFHVEVECFAGQPSVGTSYVGTYLGATDQCTEYSFTLVNEEP